MSHLVFDGDELRLSLWTASGAFVESWQASNFGGPGSDFSSKKKEAFVSWIPDGEYPFEKASRSVPQRHKDASLDTLNGTFGTLGILRLAPINYGGQLHSGIGIHAGHANRVDSRLISTKPRIQGHYGGPHYRTNGCIRTTEAAMHAIAAAIAKDPLEFLKVQNNGKHPIGKEAGLLPSRL
jgi:hypothetical protein